VQAPSRDRFPAYPVSWYLFAPSHALRRGPISRAIFGRRLVAFRTESGRAAVLDARCSHFGADLGRGCVRGEAIRCAFHQWEYAADGRCVHIPRAARIPPTAGQASYPVVERHSFLFVFNGSEPLFELPFFPGVRPEDLVPTRPFGFELACPWYLIGANFFDLQHFRGAHDRQVIGEPRVDCPAPFARRAGARFRIAGHSWQDRLTRRFAGDEVEMTIIDWCGNLMFTTARFARTCSYGMAITEPTADGGVTLTLIVFVPRSRGTLGRRLIDPLNGQARRLFIKNFLAPDAERLNGISYSPCGLINEDRHLAEYLQWLAVVAHGTSHSDIKDCAEGDGGTDRESPGGIPAAFAARGGSASLEGAS
jgi:phenylpropionate dioxygenase-like ring-hydroxylating dioxygenase large terminal subunit